LGPPVSTVRGLVPGLEDRAKGPDLAPPQHAFLHRIEARYLRAGQNVDRVIIGETYLAVGHEEVQRRVVLPGRFFAALALPR